MSTTNLGLCVNKIGSLANNYKIVKGNIFLNRHIFLTMWQDQKYVTILNEFEKFEIEKSNSQIETLKVVIYDWHINIRRFNRCTCST